MTSPDITRPAYANAYRQAYTLPRRVVPYRITFALDLFNGTTDRHLSRDTLDIMLRNLLEIDMLYLRYHPDTPSLYDSGVRYMEEPPGQEDWQDIPTTQRLGIGDCLPLNTLVVKEGYQLVQLGSLDIGDRILANGQWVKVTNSCVTGEKPILSFGLDNGNTPLRASPEHRLFLADGTEKRAEDVKVGDRLKAPSIAFPTEKNPLLPLEGLSAKDGAWLLGTYIADGWHGHPPDHRFNISGFDARPKRRKAEQKERVRQICEAVGVATSWREKYICATHKIWTEVFRACGGLAPVKRLPFMGFSQEEALSLVEGLQTDCSTANSGTLTHGTTSPVLALQLRLLYRMLNQSVHIRSWTHEEHRGLGLNPMYRIGVRRPADEDSAQSWKTRAEQYRTSVRVRSIHEEEPELCGDITVEGGMFYLPETDVLVHNCEDLACWRAAELRVRNGIDARPVFREQRRANGSYLYHIVVALPPDAKNPQGSIEDPSRILGMR